MNNRSLDLLLKQKTRAEDDARRSVERAEGFAQEVARRDERARARVEAARLALASSTRRLVDATGLSAWEFERLGAKRHAARVALEAAESRVGEVAAELRAANLALAESRRIAAEALEGRRAVEARVAALDAETRRARLARDEDDASEAVAAWSAERVTPRR